MPADLRDALRALLDWLSDNQWPGAIVGGVAVGLHGAVRTTADVDVVIFAPMGVALAAKSLGEAGFSARIKGALEFAEVNRVLLLKHSTSGTKIDVMLGVLPFEEELIQRAATIEWEGRKLPFASIEFLCVMKLIASRPKDIEDIRQLVALYPDLDRGWILDRIKEMAELVEAPDRLEIARALLKT